MRILHLDTGKEMRGGQYQALMLMRMQRDAGHDVHLLAAADSPLLTAAVSDRFEAGWFVWSAVRVCSKQCDVVHCHDARSHTVAALWSSAPFVVSRRVAFPVKKVILSRWKYRKTGLYLAVSQYVKRMLLEAGVPSSKIVIVPDSIAPAPCVSDLSGGAVALDSTDERKGGALLRQTGLPILFSRDLTSDLQHARVFLFASDMEGLGSAALLAMSYGVPVVASRVGGLPEAVQDEITGLIADNTPDAFRDATQRLLRDETLARAMGNAGRLRAASDFSPEAMFSATMDAYRQVIA